MKGVSMVGITDPGVVRDRNEDTYLIAADKGLAILADGMGGHLAGEVASAMAVDLISRQLEKFLCGGQSYMKDLKGEILVEAVTETNRAIFEASRSKPEYSGMGTTVVLAIFHGDKLSIAHVGDSRLYRLRDKQLTQLTEDHSMVQELLRRGLITPEEARTSSNKNLVTRALGVDPTVQVDINELNFNKDDVYLLCSDGLSDVLPDARIEEMLCLYGKDLQDTTERMVSEVKDKGGPDNVSIVLIRTGKRFAC